MKPLTIDIIENLLLKNNFVRLEFQFPVLDSPKYDLSWGHSEIRCYQRNSEIINIQYQHLYTENDLKRTKQNLVWSVIFGDLSRYLMFQINAIKSDQSLNTYSNFKTLSDFKKLCKFVNGIIIK